MSAPAETLSQVRTWDQVRANARRFGMCDRCSAQFAWAVQHHGGGFGAAHPPCESCRLLLVRLPVERLNGWRTVQGAASDPRNWPLSLSDEIQATTTTPDRWETSEARILRRPAHVDEALREREGGV